MTNGPYRQGRLRIARQRSTPGRNRPRLREEPPEPTLDAEISTAGRASWTHLITVTGATLAAIAAIGGLWAQAVATYWSQQTAKDQLSQSRDEDVRQVRSQAAKVAYWGGGGSAFNWGGTGTLSSSGGGSGALHVLNRSPDPVPYANIAIEIMKKDSEGNIQSGIWVLTLEGIPPCTQIEYKDSELQLGFIQAEGEEVPTVSNQEGVWRPVSMHFADTQGAEWLRTQSSLKGGEVPNYFLEAEKSRMGILGVDAKVGKVGSCNEAS